MTFDRPPPTAPPLSNPNNHNNSSNRSINGNTASYSPLPVHQTSNSSFGFEDYDVHASISGNDMSASTSTSFRAQQEADDEALARRLQQEEENAVAMAAANRSRSSRSLSSRNRSSHSVMSGPASNVSAVSGGSHSRVSDGSSATSGMSSFQRRYQLQQQSSARAEMDTNMNMDNSYAGGRTNVIPEAVPVVAASIYDEMHSSTNAQTNTHQNVHVHSNPHTLDDEAIARNLEQELRDRELALVMQQKEEEQAALQSMQRERSGRSVISMRQTAPGPGGNGSGSFRGTPPSRCSLRRACSGGCMLVIIGTAALLVLFYGSSIWDRLGGDPNDLPPFFQDNWGKGDGSAQGEFSQWRNNKKGLELTIRNALSSSWDPFFVEAVRDWNAAPALLLTTEDASEDPKCDEVRGIMKVCNNFYGKTGWTGLNEVYFEGKYIAASVAKMNEDYLSTSSTTEAEKQYVMCHELGHGFGLPHRDEIANNPDLGSCLDYTYRFSNNKQPDAVIDFENLKNLYGVIGGSERKLLRNEKSQDGKPENEKLQKHRPFEEITQMKRWHYKEGRLLHSSKHKEIYENDLGHGVRVVTTLLLAKNP